MNSKKAIIVFVILLVVGIVVGKALIEKRKRALLSYPPLKEYPVPVEYAVVKEGEVGDRLLFIGKVLPYQYAAISTKVAGTIIKVNKKEGETFKRGEVLAEIDSSEIESSVLSVEEAAKGKGALLKGLKAQLKAAEVALKNAKREYERELFLYRKGAVSKEAVEKKENVYQSAKAKVEELKAKIGELKLSIKSLKEKANSLRSSLKYTKIRALKDGVVALVLEYPGSVAFPGKPIMKVFYPQDGMRVLVKVPPSLVKELSVKGEVKVNGKPLGTLEKIYPAADAENSLAVVEVKLKSNSGLMPNQLVKVELPSKKVKGLVVPVYSLLHAKDGDFVLKFKGQSLVPVKVEVIKEGTVKAVVKGDLKPGDKVAVGRESKLLQLFQIRKAVPAEAFNG
ncbi:efflux RND transporter periplasmic adaptor subunit [Thermovibrio sp.]